MIDDLLASARRRGAEGADALLRDTETSALTFETGRLKAGTVSQERGVNLRVLVGGRVGIAGSTATDPTTAVEAAFQSGRLGETVPLVFPGPTSLPAVRTVGAAARDAPLAALQEIGRVLVERLAGDGRQVSVTVERERGTTTFANSAGQRGTYEFTEVAVAAEVTRVRHDDVLMVYDYLVGADLPDAGTLEGLAGGIAERLARAETVVEPPEGALPVLFTPHGLGAVLLPLEQGLHGKSVLQGISPLAGKLGERLFDRAFNVVDDATVDGAAGSRPMDDEGVPSRPVPLIEAGVARGFIYDLETAARAQAASTGHGSRGVFGKPRAAYSNMLVGGGDRPLAALLSEIRDGLVVEELIGVGQGNVASGAFSHPVALAYRVVGGEYAGRVKDAAVAGNSFELLKRVAGISREVRWLGSKRLPWVLLEGVSVSKR